MKIPLSVLTGFVLLMMMFFLMVEMNGVCMETYGAWHCFSESIDALERYGQTKEDIERVIKAGEEKGYEIRISKKGGQRLVSLEYRVKIPVLSIHVKQRVQGYAH